MFFKIIVFLIISCIVLNQVTAKINIGLISDFDDPSINIVFEKAIQDANSHRDFEIKGITAQIVYGNVFDASKKLCRMLQTGVSAILGPSSRTSASHLINICEAKEIPYIDTNLDFRDDRATINLYPHPQQLGRALYDLIKTYEWQQFTILYESSDYLGIFDEIISLYGNQIPSITMRKYNAGLEGNNLNILREVRKSTDNSIIILGSLATISDMLKQAQQVGIVNEHYEYIISNLDFQTLDLREYQQSDCNITAFRIVSPENEKVKDLIEALGYSKEIELREVSCPITTNMALLYDGVQLFAETAKHLNFSAPRINCFGDSHWEHGFSFNNYLAFVNSNKSLTGNIQFYFGLRTEFVLDIIELTASGLNQVGIWNSSNGIQITRPVIPLDINSEVQNESLNQTFIVLIALTPPYGMLKNSADKLTGNDQYEGFGIELIKQLAYKLGFNYTFKLQEDNDYGSYNATSGEATGMLKEIMHKRAHLAITDLTITSERALAVDFTIPFMNLGISILYRKARKEPPKLFSFMDPFSKEVWIYLGITYVGVSLSFFILGRLSPKEWDNPYPCIENPTELENQFSLSNSFWFTIGALLQQGSEIAAKAPSTRTASGAWGFFIIIMVASYTANLAAFLTIESSSNPINDVHDLAKNKGGVKYGAKRHGATINFFQGSKKYKAIYEYMKKHPELLPITNEEGVRKVLTENYAFLMESTSIEYNVERNCNLSQIGDLLDEKGYGIMMHKDFKFRDKLNYALLELQEAGAISKLKAKWWQEVTDGCSKKKKEAEVAAALGMPNMGGVFFVVLIGSIVAATFGIIKWIILTIKRAYSLKVPIKQELLGELKFVLDLSKNTKPIKRAGIVTMYSRDSSVTTQSIKGNNIDNENVQLTHKIS